MRESPTARATDGSRGFAEQLDSATRDHNLCAATPKPERYRTTDATTSAGNEGSSPGQNGFHYVTNAQSLN
jgi:hypothetical protein